MIQTNSPRVTLITLERSQKLDLLIHLISNLSQSLVICGAHGIGKTTILDELKLRKKDVWSIFNIQASAKLSFESIQNQLSRFLKQSYTDVKNQELSSILSTLSKQNEKIVFLIDDGGLLVPGLVTSLIQFASANTCLRMIFSMTHEELYLKNSSDQVIDDCHLIEIPPLTEKQCAMYVQNLSAQPGAIISMDAINDKLIEKLYRETEGVPGKIISELPNLSTYSTKRGYKWVGVVFIIAVALVVGIDFIISGESVLQSSNNEIIEPLVLEKAELVEISSPVIQSVVEDDDNVTPVELLAEVIDNSDQKLSKNNIKPLVIQKPEFIESPSPVVHSVVDTAENETSVEQLSEVKEESILLAPLVNNRANKDGVIGNSISTKKRILDKNIQKQQKLIEKIENAEKNSSKLLNEIVKKKPIAIVESAPVLEKKIDKVIIEHKTVSENIKKINTVKNESKKTKRNTSKNSDDTKWVLAQSKKHYTIQLMALSQRKSALDFLNKNIELKKDLRLFQKGKQDQIKHVLIYGSFDTYEAASKKMESLPEKFRKSWVRSFSILHKDIK